MAKKASVSADSVQEKETLIGRKPTADDWITPSGCAIIAGWARKGLTFNEIASNIGITDRTLRNWRRDYDALEKALQVNRDMATIVVENALFSKAASGDTGAICFFLKNRAPDRWRDHPATVEVELKKAELDLIKAQNEQAKLEYERKMLEYKMELLRYQISGAQGEEKDEAIREFIRAVNPTQEEIDELYEDEDEGDEVIDNDADD